MQVIQTRLGLQVAGLTAAEVADRRAHRQGNPLPPPSSRTYLQLPRENMFTFVNNVPVQ